MAKYHEGYEEIKLSNFNARHFDSASLQQPTAGQRLITQETHYKRNGENEADTSLDGSDGSRRRRRNVPESRIIPL